MNFINLYARIIWEYRKTWFTYYNLQKIKIFDPAKSDYDEDRVKNTGLYIKTLTSGVA